MIALVDGANWAEVVTAIGTGAIALGLLLAVFQLKASQRSRYATIAVETARAWDSPELVKARSIIKRFSSEEFCEYYVGLRERRDPEFHVVQREANFFEYLGVLEQFGWLDLAWINKTLGAVTLEAWEKWERCVRSERDRFSPKAYENFEELGKRIQRLRDPRWRCLPLGAVASSRWVLGWLRRVAWKVLHRRAPFAP